MEFKDVPPEVMILSLRAELAAHDQTSKLGMRKKRGNI